MKAIVYETYGPPEVLQLREVAQPVPKQDEVLVQVRVVAVTTADCRLRSLNVPRGFGLLTRLALGLRRPRRAILGSEFAGVVAATGAGVSQFRPGDAVFGHSAFGAYAEYLCMAASGPLAIKPPELSFEQAAALPFGSTTALHFLRRADLRQGDRILINGASGSVGSAAVQLARHLGAQVTGVCSPDNQALVRALGATQVIDYTREDFTQSSERWDVILDAVGTAPYSRSHRALKADGRLLLLVPTLPEMLNLPWTQLTRRHRLIAAPAVERAEDLRHLATLTQSGVINPIIDRRYPLAQAAQAHRHVDTGHKRGNVVLELF